MNEQVVEAGLAGAEKTIVTPRPIAGHTPLLEWLVGICGFVVVAGAITYLLYQGFAGHQRPPEIRLYVDSIQPVGTKYLVHVRASNLGSKTVKSLVIEGQNKAAQTEISTMTFDYLPAQSERSGGLFFSADPRGQEIQLRAQGYEEP